MSIRTLLYFICLLTPIAIFAQPNGNLEQITDSLSAVLGTTELSPKEESEILLALSRFAVFRGDFEAVENYTERALTLARRRGDKVTEAMALLFKKQEKGETGAFIEGFELVKRAVQIAKEADDPSVIASATYQLAEAHFYGRNDDQRALKLLNDFLEQEKRPIHPAHLGNIYKVLALCYAYRGNNVAAKEHYQLALEQFQNIHPPQKPMHADLGRLNSTQVLIYLCRLEYKSAEELTVKKRYAEKALTMAEEIGFPSYIGWAHENLGHYYDALGNFEATLSHFQHALMLYEQLGENLYAAEMYQKFGQVYGEMGDFSKEIKSLEKAYNLYVQTDDSIQVSEITADLGAVMLDVEDWGKAEQYLQESLAINEALADSSELASVYISMAQLQRGKGFSELAIDYLERAMEMADLFGQDELTINVALLMSSVYLEQKNWSKAEQYYLQARTQVVETAYLVKQQKIAHLGSQIYEAKGDYEQAHQQLKYYIRLRDSIYTKDAQAILKQEQVRQDVKAYQNEKEAAILQAQVLSTRNQLYFTTAIALTALLLLGSYLFFQLRQNKQLIESQNGELQQLNQTKDKFFGIIAHDIRSPIIALENVGSQINYYLEKGKTDKLQRLSERIDTTAKRLTNLLDNLLNWALLQQGGIPHQPSRIDLKTAIQETVEMFQMSAQLKQIDIAQHIENEVAVFADRNAVNTILRNLVNNAIKFTPSGGQVLIETTVENGMSKIKVQDSGIGMSEAQLAQLFQLNSKSRVGTAGERGSGLGLLLCQELVERNGGTLRVESKSGKGSIFEVQLPSIA
ncbi:MAG: tetratricopeptide repeat-containing sensor histidine kinase [Bacteroidota bacterium]